MSDYFNQYRGKGLLVILAVIILFAFFVKRTGNNGSDSTKTIDKTEIQEIVKSYIMNNPDVIIASLEDMQKRKIQEMKQKVQSLIEGKRGELENSAHSPFFGNDKGDIIIVEFFDYNCGYCKKANSILSELVANDTGVKVILKPLPILGESSEYAAKFALAVNSIRPDKFKAFHDDLMHLSSFNKEVMLNLCEKHGIEYSSIEDEMDKPEVAGELQKIRDLAMEIEINGAPAFIINGEHYSGLLEMQRLQEIIKNIRAKARS
ncbi:MAG: thiol:disulfide interchange protein DsbA [Rickettsiaceae bacterium]|jgi:protein-disulfide isomerase|nr:thiol:disulfide interchange protein DsbA [Rickettsiaceae bacterium]